MLGFFRKYQRYFFLVITVVIVISFSFFGTYNALPNEEFRVQPAFRAVDGTQISRTELNEMIAFLATDMEDKLLFGGMWGPNFLNDGVIKKDFLQTGVGEALAMEYATEIAPDYEKKLATEKRYSLYTHPEANFVSTETTWSYFAPTMLSNYQVLQKANASLEPDAFAARVKLYLGQKSFSPQMLKQVLRYQERQYSWLKPDDRLDQTDLSLFNYHTVEDWFGPRFIGIVAQFVINSAKVAEQRGYRVTKAEVLADLTRNADLSYQQNIRSPHLAVTSGQEYFSEQLRRMGMDQNRVIKIWQNVLLSRRLFQDAGNSVLVSPIMFSSFVDYAKESIEGDLYQLPKELKLGDYRSLQKLQVYLDKVAQQNPQEKAGLILPKTFKQVSDVIKETPEIVQKRYLLEVAQITKESLLPKISIKETWNWEVADANWEKLQKHFPELGLKKAETQQERFAALESLSDKIRNKVDSYARTELLESHGEWIDKALGSEAAKQVCVGLPLKGVAGDPFLGVEDVSVLIALLDKTSLGNSEPLKEQEDANKKLAQFSSDGLHYYRIKVIERVPIEEILTFAEANRKGILDKLVESSLKAHYMKIRAAQPEKFQKADKTWKELGDVKDLVADSYFSTTLKSIQEQNGEKEKLTGSQAASKRLVTHVKAIKNHLEADPESMALYVKGEPTGNGALADQWKLERKSFKVDRSSQNEQINMVEALELPTNGWSDVIQAPNGALSFYQKLEVGKKGHETVMDSKLKQAQSLLAEEIQRVLAEQLIAEYKAKEAINLEYLDQSAEMSASD